MDDNESDMALTRKLLDQLEESVRAMYKDFSRGLPFHGWHHVEFVRKRATLFARRNGAEVSIVEAAALVHDLNYMVRRNSSVRAGGDLRRRVLTSLRVAPDTVGRIELVVREAETEARDETASLEAQALSDADTLFKALPITPVMLAHLYMEETGQNIRQLCTRIIRDQMSLYERGIYFYDKDTRARYERWTKANLTLWQCIDEALELPEVQELAAFLEAGM